MANTRTPSSPPPPHSYQTNNLSRDGQWQYAPSYHRPSAIYVKRAIVLCSPHFLRWFALIRMLNQIQEKISNVNIDAVEVKPDELNGALLIQTKISFRCFGCEFENNFNLHGHPFLRIKFIISFSSYFIPFSPSSFRSYLGGYARIWYRTPNNRPFHLDKFAFVNQKKINKENEWMGWADAEQTNRKIGKRYIRRNDGINCCCCLPVIFLSPFAWSSMLAQPFHPKLEKLTVEATVL